MTTSVLLVDDHAMLREGLRAILDKEPRVAVVGECEDGHDAVARARELCPDVVVMDVGLQRLNGIDATREICGACEATRVVGLSVHSDKRYVSRMLAAGARGYVIKESATKELIDAIETVARGDLYLSPAIRASIGTGDELAALARESAWARLAPREREVLTLLANGETSRRIAELLAISPRTVETHRRNIMRKLGLHSVAELTKYAIREGLTTVE